MLNREDAYKKAFSIKSAELARKKAESQHSTAEIALNNPRLTEIERELSALGAQVAITALSGNLAALKKLQDKITALSREKSVICADAVEVTYNCPACKDTGYIGGKICDCVHALVRKLRMDELARELPVEESRFESFDLNFYPNIEMDGANPRKRMTQILKLCREYTIGFSPKKSENLLFLGNTGLGKTHLSLAIVYELTKQGFDVIYGSAYNLFSTMENEHFSYKNNDSYRAAVECDLLVIDDLGSEFVTPYIQTLIYNIVNTRLLAKKPMIINTNLSMQEMENRYTPRVASRLIGSFTAKKFVGKDIRQLKLMAK